MGSTIQELRQKLVTSLQPVMAVEEARYTARILLMHNLKLSSTALVTSGYDVVADADETAIIQQLERVLTHEPVQYVIGSAHFYGLDFYVDQSVLIPRPETEELVDMVIKENGNPAASILDIGTGSGCIAVSLKYNMPATTVEAWDISESALGVARRNASAFGVDVGFKIVDILVTQLVADKKYDVIVSNPPYIRDSEKALMHSNVLDNEPHLALFVPDADPLVFYRAIARQVLALLRKDGRLYFEINEALGDEMIVLLAGLGFEARVIKDLQGKDRFVSASIVGCC